MSKLTRALRRKQLTDLISKEGLKIFGFAILMAGVSVPAVFRTSIYLADATIRNIIGWLYAGSTALLAGLVFLVVTLENQERVRLRRGFYMRYSGVLLLLIIYLFTTLFVIFYSSRMIASLTVIQIFTITNALCIVLMICFFLTIFISPQRRNSFTRHFLLDTIDRSYAAYIALAEDQTRRQEDINNILEKYGIGNKPGLNRDPRYISIPSGASGYVTPEKRRLRQLGRELRGIMRIASGHVVSKKNRLRQLMKRPRNILQRLLGSYQKDKTEINAYHRIIFDQRIATDTPLLFIPCAIENASAVQETLSQLLSEKIRCNKDPTVTKTTYIGAMQSFREALLQEQSIDIFQDYAKILQELLFRYLNNDDFAEERSRDAKHATDPFFAVSGTNHSILGWYHRIVAALAQSQKAEHAEWIDEIFDLYCKPVWYLCNQVELSWEQKQLLYKFLQELEGRYFEAERPDQAQTELQRRIMSQYDAFLVSLCKQDQDIEAEGFDKKAVTVVTDQIITVHQARILKWVYNHSNINTFKETANKFMTFSGLILHADNFLQTAFRSIMSIARYPLSRRTNLDTVKKTYGEYCAFQKIKTLFQYAAYIFHTNEFSVTDSEAGDNPYLAFLIDGGLPTSRAQFIYLYSMLLDNPFMVSDNEALWGDWDSSEPPSRIDSSGVSGGFVSDKTFGFFCWYNIHRCEPTPSLDEEQISKIFSLSFRGRAEELAQQFQNFIGDSDTLGKQQQGAVNSTVKFLRSLSQSYAAERHQRIVQSNLREHGEARITEAKKAFQAKYRTDNKRFLEVLQSLQIDIADPQPLIDTASFPWNTRELREKIWYIPPIGDGVGYSGLQHEYSGYAHACIQTKIVRIWERWKKRIPQVSPASFFDALRNLDDDYIVLCNSANSPYIAHVWGELFPEQQYPYRFIASYPNQGLDMNDDIAFHKQIATIEFQDNNINRKIPVAYFSNIYRASLSTVTFLILKKSPKGSAGTFQQYSFEQEKEDGLLVNEHAVHFKITDLGEDEELMQEAVDASSDSAAQDPIESNNLSPEERRKEREDRRREREEHLKEYVRLEIKDAFDFTYPAPSDAPLCGYIECDFNSARRRKT